MDTPQQERPTISILNRIDKKIDSLFQALDPVLTPIAKEGLMANTPTTLIQGRLREIETRLTDLLDSISL